LKIEQLKQSLNISLGLNEEIQFKMFARNVPFLSRKKLSKKHGIPEKEAETRPWQKLCVDLIGPYKIKNCRND